MGAAIPANVTAITILSTAWAIRAFPGQKSAMVLALLIAIPSSVLFRELDILARYYNVIIVHWIESGVRRGNDRRISYGVFYALLVFFLKSFVFYALCIFVGRFAVAYAYGILPSRILLGLEISWYLLPLVGLGQLMVQLRFERFPCIK